MYGCREQRQGYQSARSANVDIKLELRDAYNHLIADANPASTQDASISRSVPQGVYHVVVRHNGQYGAIGKYSLVGTGISTLGYTSTGPRVIFSGPERPAVEPFTRGPVYILVTFDKPINHTTFSPMDVTFVSPTGRRVQAYRIEPAAGEHGGRTFRIQAHLPEYGTYRIEIGPNVYDRYGNSMDQDRDGIKGELLSDRYSTFAVTRQMPTLGNISRYLTAIGYNS